jgi:hypothetical protein
MAKPVLKIVTSQELQELFNNGGYRHRVLGGEFSQKLLREGKPRAGVNEPPGTKSQIIAYLDAKGRMIAVVHQYLRPDGTLGASGRPDPKKLLLNGILYEAR